MKRPSTSTAGQMAATKPRRDRSPVVRYGSMDEDVFSKSCSNNYDYCVVEASRKSSGGNIAFHRRGLNGMEVVTVDAEKRFRVFSPDQAAFPEPESGCGPTAILNWIYWYQREGILHKPIDGSGIDLLLKHNFRLIETELMAIKGRTQGYRGGTTALDICCAFDRVTHRLSQGLLRMHTEYFRAPISLADLFRFTTGNRAIILVTRVIESNGQPSDTFHAVSLVHADNDAYLMVNNWGQRLYGALRNEPDGQFFRPKDAQSVPLRIEFMLGFIPFRPKIPSELSSLPTPQLPANRYGNPLRQTPGRLGYNPPNKPDDDGQTFSELRIQGVRPIKNYQHQYAVKIENLSNFPRRIYIDTLRGVFDDGSMDSPSEIEGLPDYPQIPDLSTRRWPLIDPLIPAQRTQWIRLAFLPPANGSRSLKTVRVHRP